MAAMKKVLKDPLHAILGNLDLLEKETDDELELDLIKKAELDELKQFFILKNNSKP